MESTNLTLKNSLTILIIGDSDWDRRSETQIDFRQPIQTLATSNTEPSRRIIYQEHDSWLEARAGTAKARPTA